MLRNKLNKLLISIALIPLFASGLFSLETPTKLKIKQPNWRLKVLESYSNKQPKKACFFEPQVDTNFDLPVKIMTYTLEGLVDSETDILPVDTKDFSKGYIEHGPSIIYDSTGQVSKIFFYNQGILQDSIKTYYQNGVLEAFYTVKDNQLEGSFFKHHPNGEIAEKGHYLDGSLCNSFEKYNKNGNKIASYQYKKGLIDGEAFEWYDNGTLKARYFYRNGLLNGDKNNIALTRYHQNGHLSETLNFQNGQPFGHHIRYFDDGKKEEYRVFYTEGKKHGLEQTFDINGNVLSNGEYDRGVKIKNHVKKDISGAVIFTAAFDEKGKSINPAKEFDLKGNLKAEYFLLNDLINGPYTEWYPSGNIAKRLNFVNGQLDGLQQEYLDLDDQKLKLRVTYKNGEKQGLYEEWTNSGTPKVTLNYTLGIKQGNVLTFHSNGIKSSKANFNNDLYDGLYEAWNDNETLVFKTSYREGKEHGEHIEWHDNGDLKYKANFFEGLLDGLEEEFFLNGNKAIAGNYNHGIADGKHTKWFQDGHVQEEHHYSNGLSIGVHTIYHESQNENAPIVSRFINYENGKLQGDQKSYYPNGQIQALMTYFDGDLIGKKMLWDEDGAILEEGNYSADGLNGRYYLKKPDGKEYVYHYKNNILEGIHQVYYPPNSSNERIKAYEANYLNGLLDKEVAEYNESGIKIKSTLYQNGLREGLTKIYQDDGRLKIVAEFHNGNQNGMAYEYYSNGNIKKQVLFKEDKKVGEEKQFFPNEEIATITPYQNGNIHGTLCEWNDEGTLIFKAEYRDGLKHGNITKFDADGKVISLQTYVNDELKKTLSEKP